MVDYGVTTTGFVRKPIEAILDDIAARQRSEIDPLWNTEADSLAGQYNGIFADHIAQLWEVLEAEYYSLSRDSDGNALDIIGALTATPRNAAKKSKVTLTLALAATTTVPAGSIVSVDGDPSIRVVTLADAENLGGSPANVEVVAQAEAAGAITANPGTLTVIETQVTGWTSVTNDSSLTGGTPIELDDAYRIRQLSELAAGGGGSLPGIRADLLRIEGVLDAVVIENDEEVEVDGMPPKSVAAIVLADNPADDDVTQAIGDTLFASKSGGVKTHGDEAVTVTDAKGVEHEVRFSRPEEVPIYGAIGLTVTGDYEGIASAVADAIRDASVNSDDPAYLGIGTDVYAARWVVTALSVPGVLNAKVGLSLSSIADPDSGLAAIEITDRQLATISPGDIQPSEL
jgi:uncharacterized phage protein gp47/JayE